MEKASEDLCVRIFEARQMDVQHRPIADETVIVEWRSVVPSDKSAFFLPAIGRFMTAFLRPLFDPHNRNYLTEASALSLLSAGTAGALMIACSYESSVRYTLSALEDRACDGVLARSVVWCQRAMPLRQALIEKWRPLIARWCDSAGASEADSLDALLEAMRRHQGADRGERIERCCAHVRLAPTMSDLRDVDRWEEKLDEALSACSDDEIEYLSECCYRGFRRLQSDVKPFRTW